MIMTKKLVTKYVISINLCKYDNYRLDDFTSSIDGGGWKLVRRIPTSDQWFNLNDDLAGTENAGDKSSKTGVTEWTRPFNHEEDGLESFTQLLFATGMLNHGL